MCARLAEASVGVGTGAGPANREDEGNMRGETHNEEVRWSGGGFVNANVQRTLSPWLRTMRDRDASRESGAC